MESGSGINGWLLSLVSYRKSCIDECYKIKQIVKVKKCVWSTVVSVQDKKDPDEMCRNHRKRDYDGGEQSGPGLHNEFSQVYHFFFFSFCFFRFFCFFFRYYHKFAGKDWLLMFWPTPTTGKRWSICARVCEQLAGFPVWPAADEVSLNKQMK